MRRLIAVNSILVLAILAFNILFLAQIEKLFFIINFFCALLFAMPFIIIKYSAYRRKKEIEEMFTVFLRDFVEAIRGGMLVPQAFKHVARNNYKALSPHIKKISEQLEWGISLERVLLNFARAIRSKLIGRVISSVIETHRSGGRLPETLEALTNAAVEIKRLRAERTLYMHSQLITGYIIFRFSRSDDCHSKIFNSWASCSSCRHGRPGRSCS